VPLGARERCPKCGTGLPGEALYCPNCGEARVAATDGPSTGALVLTFLGGIVTALPVWWWLSGVGLGLLSNVGRPAGYTPEFYVSWGAMGYFLFLTLRAFAGLIVVVRSRLPLPARVFIIAFLSVTLGLFSICDLFALSSRSQG
jgi:hypothetical protein